MYRWWLLAFISYLLAHWQFLASQPPVLDWQQATQQARQQLFPQEVLACFLQELAEMRPVLAELGIAVTVDRVPVAA